MTRRAPITTKPSLRPFSLAWPPTCGQCGWDGEPNDRQSPYIACGGDPTKHIRAVIGRQAS
jgi:hypothetical protein